MKILVISFWCKHSFFTIEFLHQILQTKFSFCFIMCKKKRSTTKNTLKIPLFFCEAVFNFSGRIWNCKRTRTEPRYVKPNCKFNFTKWSPANQIKALTLHILLCDFQSGNFRIWLVRLPTAILLGEDKVLQGDIAGQYIQESPLDQLLHTHEITIGREKETNHLSQSLWKKQHSIYQIKITSQIQMIIRKSLYLLDSQNSAKFLPNYKLRCHFSKEV